MWNAFFTERQREVVEKSPPHVYLHVDRINLLVLILVMSTYKELHSGVAGVFWLEQ